MNVEVHICDEWTSIVERLRQPRFHALLHEDVQEASRVSYKG